MVNKKTTWITCTLVLGMLFFLAHHLFSFSLFGAVHQLSSIVLYPVLKFQKIIVEPIKQWSEQRASNTELYATIDVLRTEQDALVAENIRLQSTIAYYKDIDELVKFNKRYTDKGFVAQILVRNLSNREHFFLVEGGSAQGIDKDMVATYKNNLIGRVVEVYPWYSKIQLITDVSCQVAAFCTRTRAQGIHKGTGDQSESILDYVSHLDRLQMDDLVVSSGEGLVFPKGFALGKIISYVPDDLYQQVTVKPIVDFRSIKYCTLLVKK